MRHTRPGGLAADYRGLLQHQWSPWAAGILVGLLNVMMFAYGKPWAVADGVQNWGNWVLLGFGVNMGAQVPPWLYTTSFTNLGVILGALIGALLSGQFALRFTTGRDLVRSMIGGVLLGIGAVLGMGCTIGGFLSAFSALSLAGPLFMIGLFVGAYMGLKLLVWELAWEKPATPKPAPTAPPGGNGWKDRQPYIGLALLIGVLILLSFDGTEFTYRGITGLRSVLLLLAIALGVVNQRARFCFVRAFREPFMTGDGSMTKGAALALLVGLLGFAVIKGSDLNEIRDVMEAVRPSVVLGSLLGGLIFGIGMVLTGGCASGSLWRLGEGQLKFVLVLLMFSVSNALFAFTLRFTGWRNNWGEDSYFLPDSLTWPGALAVLGAIAIAWALLAAWNEKTEKMVIV
ncbi:MAG: YeeE/YedE thiosulfate transporter family protein [bacterium]